MQEPFYLHTPYQGDNGQHMLKKEAASIQTKSSPSILDKMAEGLELTFSHKNTKITTHC